MLTLKIYSEDLAEAKEETVGEAVLKLFLTYLDLEDIIEMDQSKVKMYIMK